MRRLRSWLVFGVGLLLALCPLLAEPVAAPLSLLSLRSTGLGQRPPVLVLISESSPPYQETAVVIQRALGGGGSRPEVAVQVVPLNDWPSAASAPRILVALGSAACDRLAATELQTPVLCALLPQESFERVLQQRQRRASPALTALVLNQPPKRQLNLIRLALPAARRVGVLWGPQSLQQANAFRAATQGSGLELLESTVAGEAQLAGGLRSVLPSADVLLAIADPLPYNTMTLPSILQAAMREHVPVVAFSPAYSRAGALLALYATPTQVGEQAAALVRQALLGHPLPAAPVTTVEFSVDVNAPVARALGLSLDANDLLAKLRKREGLK